MLRFWNLVLIALSLGCGSAVSAADFATRVMDATFKLYHPESTATCFLVQRTAPAEGIYLVTAAHVLERTKGETATLVLREAQSDGDYARRDHTIWVRTGENPRWVKHAKEDVAVLRLIAPLPVAVEALPEELLATPEQLKANGLHICSPLYALTYPQRVEANAAGLPIARLGIFATTPTLPVTTHPTFFADYTTFAGDSGGPVFTSTNEDAAPLIVGIVLAQTRFDERTASEYEERLVHHPMGLGTVLHAQLVRDTLNLASQAAESGEKSEKSEK